MKRYLFASISLFLIFATYSKSKPKIWVLGDSTLCNYASSFYPRTGWAQVLSNYLDFDSVEVHNRALSGRSSKSYLTDASGWSAFKDSIKAGDYVIIEFGHNDEKTDDEQRGTLPGSTFEQYLSIYVDFAKSVGAIPILATPIQRNSWKSDNVTLNQTHVTSDGDYPKAIRNLAASKNITLVDMTQLTNDYFQTIGKNATIKLFMNLVAGAYSNYPNGSSDNTHLQESGAKAVGNLFVSNVSSQKLMPLGSWLKGDLRVNQTVKYSFSALLAQGQGSVSPSGGSYDNSSSITVTAKPASGYIFDHWGGDLTGNANPAALVMNGNIEVYAYFIQDNRNYYTVNVTAEAGGSVTVTPDDTSVVEGTSVMLAAVPNSGWIFGGWNGDKTGMDSVWTVNSLNRNISVAAFFIPVDKYVYQAENGILEESVLETKNTGFTGEAYVNYNAVTGSSVEIPVYSDAAGEKTVLITFANGSGAERVLSASVNGTQQIASVQFGPTSSWTTWNTKKITLTLPEGASTITLATINGLDGPNLDKITIDMGATSTVHRIRNVKSLSFYNLVQKTLYINTELLRVQKVSIYSMGGKNVLSLKTNTDSRAGKVVVKLNKFNPGVYLLKFESDEVVRSEYLNLL